jgi:hypothetical protein
VNGAIAGYLCTVTVGPVTMVIGLLLFAGVIAVGLWAVRLQNKQFPKGFDRTGWNPERGHAGWLLTKFTWLSGGRGQ